MLVEQDIDLLKIQIVESEMINNSIDEIAELSTDEIENVGGAWVGVVIVVAVVLAAAYYAGRESAC